MTWPPRPGAPADPQARAFLDAIADRPEDATARLVFADWLEERGDPRAELMRIRAASLHNPTEAERRAEAWQAAHGRDWLGDVAGACDEVRPLSGELSVGEPAFTDYGTPYNTERFLNDPGAEGLRRAVREGWFPRFWMNAGWRPADIKLAAELGLLAGARELNLAGNFTDESLALLAGRAPLRVLRLRGTTAAATDEGVASLGRLSGLRRLVIVNLPAFTGAGLTGLSGLKELRTLDLWGLPRFGDAALEHLRALPALEVLRLAHCPALTDHGLARLSGPNGLRVLDLEGNDQLTGEGLAHLARLPNVTHLSLSQCRGVKGENLAHLAGFAGLRHLSLFYCGAAVRAGAAHLRRLENLELLDLRACDLKPHVVRSLRAALPGCAVVRKGDLPNPVE